MNTSFEIYPIGDRAITVSFGEQINLATNNKVLSLFNDLKATPIKGVVDLIPAYCSLTLVYDVIEVKKICKAEQTAFNFIRDLLEKRLDNLKADHAITGTLVSIPVCYDVSLAPDITFVAEQHGLTTKEVIEIHTSTTYHVYMIGFLPGFPYMATVDERIATPRKATPLSIVPAGSVGIAGEQTGIYPQASPGGWQLIGRTPLQLFNASSEQPALLKPGDQVEFYSISFAQFTQLKR